MAVFSRQVESPMSRWTLDLHWKSVHEVVDRITKLFHRAYPLVWPTVCYGKPPFWMDRSSINTLQMIWMAICNSKLFIYQSPDDPCMVYLPTKLSHLWGIFVGKYTSTMDHLGRVHVSSWSWRFWKIPWFKRAPGSMAAGPGSSKKWHGILQKKHLALGRQVGVAWCRGDMVMSSQDECQHRIGGLEHEYCFSYIYWEVYHPNWRTHIFSEGSVQPPISSCWSSVY